jgi:hypothetical protein
VGRADAALSRSDRFLHVLAGRANATGTFEVSIDRSLALAGQSTGLPPGVSALAAR